MTREIKFRLYDSTEKKMDGPYEISDAYFNHKENRGRDYARIIMQFTGLHDKNGKEIYEGDIRREEIEHDEGDDRRYYICVWIKERSMFSWLTQSEYDEYSEDNPQDFDIIFEHEDPYPLNSGECDKYIICGNIHQNPELLK